MLWGLTTVVIRATRLVSISAEKLLFYQLAVSAAVFPFLSLYLGEQWSWHFSPFAITSLLLQTVIGAFRELPGLDVDAGALPGHQNLGVCVFHAAVRAAVRRAVAEESVTTGLLVALATVAAGIVLVNRKPSGA